MLITVDSDSPEPLYAQIVAVIRAGVARGEIAVGERLPAARDLADSLGVNMHTVLRAYNDLRDLGLVEVRRGRGAVVTGRPDRHADVDAAVEHLLDVGRRHGLSLSQLHDALEEGAR